jgi:hypothetical protein
VFRPNVAAYWERIGKVGRIVLAGVAVVGLSLLMLGVQSTRLLAGVATVIGLAAVVAAYMYNVRVEVDAEEVRLHGMFGGVKRWQRSAIKGFRVLEVVFRGVGRSKPIAFAYGNDCRTLFTLEAAFWAKDELRAIGNALGGATLLETVTTKEAISRYPGCLNFADRHYWLVGGSIPFVVIALVFVLAPYCAPGH